MDELDGEGPDRLHRGELRQAEEAAATAEGELVASGPRFRTQWVTWARALELHERLDAARGAGRNSVNRRMSRPTSLVEGGHPPTKEEHDAYHHPERPGRG